MEIWKISSEQGGATLASPLLVMMSHIISDGCGVLFICSRVSRTSIRIGKRLHTFFVHAKPTQEPGGQINRFMKRVLMLVGLVAAIVLSGATVSAQIVSEKKVEKDAKKQAKILVKEGWKVAPGHPSIEMQQLKAAKINNTTDEDFNSKYVMGSAQAVAPTYDAAKYQATELAKIDIAGKISSELAGIAKTNMGNQQVNPDQAENIVKTIGAYKSFVASKLTNIISCIDMYKQDSRTGKYTVSIGIFYNRDEAIKAGMKEVREQMMKESEDLANELDALLGLKK